MEIAIIFIATILFVIYVFLIMTAGNNITEAISTCKREIASENIKTLTIKMNKLVERMKQRDELDDKKSIKKGKELKAKLDENKKKFDSYENGKLFFEDFFPIAGYRFIQLMK